MAEILDDVAYLSREIGPRPAGTEEEQQAALFVADRVHASTNLKAEIEDIKCNADSTLVDLIYFGVAFLAVVLSLVAPSIGLLALILSILSAACFLCEEKFNRPLLSKILSRDASQNVVVKYRPEAAVRSGSRRKVIVVANYDSGKVKADLKPGLLSIWGLLSLAADIAMVASPVILLFKNVIFLNALGFVSGFFSLLAIVAAVLLLVPVVRAIIHRAGAYNEAANVNASGVAVLLDLVRRVGGEPVAAEPAPQAQDEEPVIQGEYAARAAGVVPEGVELNYEAAPQVVEAAPVAAPVAAEPAPAPVVEAAPAVAPVVEAPAPAAAPVAAEPAVEETPAPVAEPVAQPAAVAEEAPAPAAEPAQVEEPAEVPASAQVEDIAEEPVQEPVEVAEEPQTAVDRLRAAKAAIAAITGAPVDDNIYATDIKDEPVVVEETPITIPDQEGQVRMRGEMLSALGGPRVDELKAAEQQEAQAQSPVVAAPVQEEAPAAAPVAPVAPAPMPMPAPAPAVNQPAVPDWYRTAREKAKRPATPAGSVHRSRYADALDSAVKESAVFFNEANQLVDAETETRLRNMRRGISEVKPPSIPAQTTLAPAAEAEPAEAPAAAMPALGSTAPQPKVVVEEPAPAPVVAEPVVEAAPAAAVEAAPVAEPAVEPVVEPAAEPVMEAAPAPAPESVPAEAPEAAPAVTDEMPAAPAPVAAPAAEPVAEPEPVVETIPAPEPAPVVTPAPAIETQIPSMAAAVAAPVAEEAAAEPVVVEYAEPVPTEEPVQSLEFAGELADDLEEHPEPVSNKINEDNPVLGETVAMPPIAMPAPAPAPIPAPVAIEEPGEIQPRVKLPEIPSANMAPIADSARQRAPLAQASEEDGKATAAKSLLSRTIPKIDAASLSGDLGKPLASETAGITGKRQNLMQNLPSLSGSITSEPSLLEAQAEPVVSTTGSFAAVSATGSFAPVGDELVADVAPEELYIEDADDSIAEGGVTETGAFAGPDYVDMPKSRRGRFFSRFRRKKDKQEEVSTPQEWLDVQDDFDAHSVGSERGDWGSFQQGDARAHAADRSRTFENVGADQAYDSYDAYDGYDAPYDGYETYDANDGEVPNGMEPAYSDGYAETYDAYTDEDNFDFEDAVPNDSKKWEGGAFSGRRSSAGRTVVTEDDVDYAEPVEQGEPQAEPGRRGNAKEAAGNVLGKLKGGAANAASAAGGLKDRFGKRGKGEEKTERSSSRRRPERSAGDRRASRSNAEARAAALAAANEPVLTPRVSEELQEIYQFAETSLDTEVWFVALGAQESDNAGLKQFIEAHREDLRGAVIVSLEGLGAGTLGYGNTEGVFKKTSPSTRVKRFLHSASQATGISLAQSDQTWRQSAAATAAAAGVQAVTIMGLDGNKPAFYAQSDDVVENIDEELIARNADFVMEFLKAF